MKLLVINGIIFYSKEKYTKKILVNLRKVYQYQNLIEVQKDSYNEFLTSKFKKDQLEELTKGINKVFKSVFPIEDGSRKSNFRIYFI